MACLNLCLFGPPHLELDGVPLEIKRRKTMALLVYLAVTRQSHTREALATLFWPENGPSQYQECVRVLNEELGVEPQPETTALYQKQRADGGRHPVERSFITRPQARSNLPASLTSFIGRDNEMAELKLRLTPGAGGRGSREALAVPGEIAYQVPPLSIPPPLPVQPPGNSLQALLEYESIRLFVDRDFTIIRAHLDEPVITAFYNEGQALTLAEAVTGEKPLPVATELVEISPVNF